MDSKPVTPDKTIPAPWAYKVGATATALGVHADTVRAWIEQGHIKCVRLGRTVLIPAAEVRRILSSGGDD